MKTFGPFFSIKVSYCVPMSKGVDSFEFWKTFTLYQYITKYCRYSARSKTPFVQRMCLSRKLSAGTLQKSVLLEKLVTMKGHNDNHWEAFPVWFHCLRSESAALETCAVTTQGNDCHSLKRQRLCPAND